MNYHIVVSKKKHAKVLNKNPYSCRIYLKEELRGNII